MKLRQLLTRGAVMLAIYLLLTAIYHYVAQKVPVLAVSDLVLGAIIVLLYLAITEGWDRWKR